MSQSERVDVAIVGGGPVGLALACLLALRDKKCVVLEKRREPAPHSRAIGIHPPGFAVLVSIGLEDQLLERGVRITGGQVFYGHKPMGRLSLATGDKYSFVLSLPQTETEKLLETRLNELAPGAMRRGVSVTGCTFRNQSTVFNQVVLDVTKADGETEQIEAAYTVACDGKNSAMREAAGISFSGSKYPDCYLMGDFADNTSFGTDAALFLTSDGIVESFPLPGTGRRWVAHLSERTKATDAQELAAIVRERTGQAIPTDTCTWMSAFGIEHRLAQSMYRDDFFLAGDAAHVVSPIGGQGMNLGLLDAAYLADYLVTLNGLYGQRPDELIPHTAYDAPCKVRAKKALGRAAFNTTLGRPCPPWHPYRAVAGAILHIPALAHRFARVFTMQDIR